MAPVKLPAFFKRPVAAAAPRIVRVLSRSHQHYIAKNSTEPNFLKLGDSSEFSSKGSTEISFNDEDRVLSCTSNRVMVVVDSSLEAKSALQWALSHTLQSQDTIILLHVYKPSISNHGSSLCPTNQKAYEILHSMKKACQMSKPGAEVEIAAVRQGKEKAAIIVEEAKQRNVSLLVLGQKRRSIMWRLQKIWKPKKRSRNSNTKRVVDYCIQNAKCLTIAVRSKGRKSGGYLITTKRHKNFWLLA